MLGLLCCIFDRHLLICQNGGYSQRIISILPSKWGGVVVSNASNHSFYPIRIWCLPIKSILIPGNVIDDNCKRNWNHYLKGNWLLLSSSLFSIHSLYVLFLTVSELPLHIILVYGFEYGTLGLSPPPAAACYFIILALSQIQREIYGKMVNYKNCRQLYSWKMPQMYVFSIHDRRLDLREGWEKPQMCMNF